MANQANLEDLPSEKLAALEKEYSSIQEQNKTLLSDLKTKQAGAYMRINSILPPNRTHPIPFLELARIKSTPTDAQLTSQIEETTIAVCLPPHTLPPV